MADKPKPKYIIHPFEPGDQLVIVPDVKEAPADPYSPEPELDRRTRLAAAKALEAWAREQLEKDEGEDDA